MADGDVIIDLVPGRDYRDAPDIDNNLNEVIQTPPPKGLRDLTEDVDIVRAEIDAIGNKRPISRQYDQWNSERAVLFRKSEELTAALDGHKRQIASVITHEVFRYDPESDTVMVLDGTLGTRTKLIAEGVHPDWVNVDSDGRLDPNTRMFIATMSGSERLAEYVVPEAAKSIRGFDSEAIDYLTTVREEAKSVLINLPKSLNYLKSPSDGMVPSHLKLNSDFRSEEHPGNGPTILERHKHWVRVSGDLKSYANGRRPKRK